MEIFRKIEDYRLWRRSQSSGQTFGFVPTMGALHSGHLKLVAASQAKTSKTVVSIFVNPLQFGPKEDFSRYPRPFETDSQLCQQAGVAAIFAPEVKDFYQGDHATYVNVNGLDKYLCGAARPGHFQGVCTVVLKLFNIVQPTIAFFGQKDIQQALILKKMVRDLSVDLEMEIIPTIREASGLALSSRNIYLSPDEKERAASLSRGLAKALAEWAQGERSADKLKAILRHEIEASNPSKVDYIEAVSQARLEPVETFSEPGLLAVAVYYGQTRLIDNVLLG
jgi:pantoate--beta-alanine ligase